MVRLWKKKPPKLGATAMATPSDGCSEWVRLLEPLGRVEELHVEPAEDGDGPLGIKPRGILLSRGEEQVRVYHRWSRGRNAYVITIAFQPFTQSMQLGQEVEAILLKRGCLTFSWRSLAQQIADYQRR